MRITIIGAGNVGRVLGGGWKASGHDVAYALRTTTGGSADALRADGFAVVPMNQAGDGEVIVLAVPWPAVTDAVGAAGTLAGKTMVDATNPLTSGLELAVGMTDSGGETVARLAPGALVVKAFNTTGAENMGAARSFPVKPMMAMAGDDAGAKAAVAKLAEDLGFEPLDAGPLKAARLLEPMAVFWIKQAIAQGKGPRFAFAVVRR